MNELVAAFLNRFKHPIMYSVITSLVIWNFDFIYLLSIAPFHIYELSPYEILFDFSQELSVNQKERVCIPIIKGFLVGVLLPSSIDIVYSTFVSFAMSLKEKGINWGERKSWSYQISLYKNTSLELAKKFENTAFWVNCNIVSNNSNLMLFRVPKYVSKNQIVKYNKKKNELEFPDSLTDKVLGLVLDIFHDLDYALVITRGSFLDKSNAHILGANQQNGTFRYQGNGNLEFFQDSNNPGAYARVRGNKEFEILIPNQDDEVLNLSLEHRLFGSEKFDVLKFIKSKITRNSTPTDPT
ncbi:hypothetical protein [Leptospira kmetyi]|uniref:Uncharacterized protein n=1 Tax=Leptospira kmetyi TaxID=408139 RepID=A0ABX4N707_9LEPT|nr:hypothetical protein [Leptospira kmetyi]PJZ29085.1 hypothetical protein CH378_14460 [Leptospira kmetyi]PJZ39748.1 hypothetical protein CH370_20055 [Leptospira kmetyi]